jgi:hypothetical protein
MLGFGFTVMLFSAFDRVAKYPSIPLDQYIDPGSHDATATDAKGLSSSCHSGWPCRFLPWQEAQEPI